MKNKDLKKCESVSPLLFEKKNTEEQLREALAIKNEFISIASHELKTPLTALKLQVEMAKKNLDKNLDSLPPEKVKSIINRTHQDILRLSRIVDDMLDVSRINTGKFRMNYEFFGLEEFFEDVLTRAYTGTIEHENIKVKVHAPVLVKWDKFRIEQVILNLLSNAIRYGNDSRIDLNVSTGGGYAYIKVRDHGPGISPENQKKIFERYQQGGLKLEKEGLGLGLYISNEIVKQHNGLIGLESKLGEGTSFEVKLPLNS